MPKGTKYTFELDAEGRAINPVTKKVFEFGDIMPNGRMFRHFRKIGSLYRIDSRTPEYVQSFNESRSGPQRTLSMVASARLSGARQRCKKSGGRVTITKKWVEERIEAGYVVNGVKIGDFQIECVDEKRGAWGPSLDRIDSNNPNYSPENVQVVPTLLNDARNEHSDDDFLAIAGPWVDYLRQKKLESHI
jgi:hypothetical protein